VRAAALAELVARDLRRSRRSFFLAALGITVGVATLTFFLALSEAMRTVVLGRIFPLDQVEVIPPESSVGSVFSAVLGGRPPGVEPAQITALRRAPGVRAVLPRMRFAFPTSGRGGRAVFGRDVGAGEIPADGVEAALVQADLPPGTEFSDPDRRSSRRPCAGHDACTGGEFCVLPGIPRAGEVPPGGTCQRPIPVVISPYLLEVFDNVIAPAHRLPKLGAVIARSAQGLTLEWDLGRAGLGAARQGTPRRVYATLVGVSRHAMELGLTVPLDVARRLNAEYAGEGAAAVYSSAVVYLRAPAEVTPVSAAIRAQGLEIRTSGAEQMGLLVTAITVILALASGVTVLVASLNIAHAFLALIAERRGELGLMRALGATRRDVATVVLAQAAAIGVLASAAGLLLARLAAAGANTLAATRLPAFPFKPDQWFVFTPGIVLGVAAFGVGACVLSAVIPALRASRTEPAGALSGGV
jgi:putative ABC transport system permease protein